MPRLKKTGQTDRFTHKSQNNHIPDYTFDLDGDLFIIRSRSEFTDLYTEPETIDALDQIALPKSADDNARKHAGGYDLYFLEREWRDRNQRCRRTWRNMSARITSKATSIGCMLRSFEMAFKDEYILTYSNDTFAFSKAIASCLRAVDHRLACLCRSLR